MTNGKLLRNRIHHPYLVVSVVEMPPEGPEQPLLAAELAGRRLALVPRDLARLLELGHPLVLDVWIVEVGVVGDAQSCGRGGGGSGFRAFWSRTWW